jgi:hypothetical protein
MSHILPAFTFSFLDIHFRSESYILSKVIIWEVGNEGNDCGKIIHLQNMPPLRTAAAINDILCSISANTLTRTNVKMFCSGERFKEKRRLKNNPLENVFGEISLKLMFQQNSKEKTET